ncbi:MAG: guanylate kinase [Eubacterium sp.]|nr:guanylate kinase [Eubacterium sp.]
MSKGKLIVISGFSGAGKGTVVKKLVEKYDYSLSISATTRQPREGEVDGKDYYFKSEAEFRSLIDYNGLIEWAQYVDNFYGTPRKFVEEEMAAGKNVILEIEVQGAMNVKSQYPNAILIFITTKDVPTLRKRLTNRGTESTEVINKRLARAAEEATSMESYEFIVVNDDLDTCVDAVNSIVVSESCKKENVTEFLIDIKNQLESLDK